ncbi:uncharacterized protein PFL1_00489 [Pseudozyma flocculosa PF-1]|uniref:Uncharacterized protein n=1 Tax=Pseudozyma flocculosa TaxID=84751 RepID=A0A5C3ERM3_9BASI|nr:uncharacterized protein PFL1_00489 [Pseudozyma flocculosa PF-1]EPQ32292.1 hypothetical protein PFL1_00489 [Pseudozyma flocculosa PF-1]SPO34752.1 uncharacterized protein PSFLO_00223 [Pseudozyma flocculosa]
MIRSGLPASGQHDYPPSITIRPPSTHLTTPSSSSKPSRPTPSTLAERSDTVRYRIHPHTQQLSDHRLQVSSYPGPSSSRASDGQLEPIWYRERSLSEDDEIVDQLVDCHTSDVAWTVHRPTRGWYLHLRSPHLPRGTAIALRSANARDDDHSVTPLAFSLRTTIRGEALAQAQPMIDLEAPAGSSSSPRKLPLVSVLPRQAHEMSREGAGRAKRRDDYVPTSPPDIAAEARATGRAETAHAGHARKRSAAGSGTHSYGSRKAFARSELATGDPTIEEDDEGDTSTAARSGPSESTEPAVNGRHKAPRSPHADRPYSPVEPRPFGSGIWSQHSAMPKGKARLLEPGPMDCTFVLCDGARQPFISHAPSSIRAGHNSGSAASPSIALAGKQGWARWAWNLLPRDVRPVLPLDTDKSFSLWWIDPPLIVDQQGPSATAAEGGAATTTTRPIEVLRFVDESGWWLWDAGTRGGLTVQQKAVEAIGLQQQFWIATALAYLDFLETKDGYEAAKEG